MKHTSILAALASLALTAQSASAITTYIDDHFNDGNVATNTTGTGTGFTILRQTGASTVIESGTILTTTTPANQFVSMVSDNSFDFFNAAGRRGIWEISSTTYGDDARHALHAGFVDDSIGINDAVRPFVSPEAGLYVRLTETNLPATHATLQGFLGGVIVTDGAGNHDILDTWAWDGVWDGLGALTVNLRADNTGYTVVLDGNLGSTSASGLWTELVNATSFTTTFGSSNAVASWYDQGLNEAGNTALDRVTVEEVPEPSRAALLALALGAALLARRRG